MRRLLGTPPVRHEATIGEMRDPQDCLFSLKVTELRYENRLLP
jgi:hypothetical protein